MPLQKCPISMDYLNYCTYLDDHVLTFTGGKTVQHHVYSVTYMIELILATKFSRYFRHTYATHAHA